MKNIIKARKATSSIFATLLIIIITIASGITLYSFVLSKVDFIKTTFNTQMTNLLLKSFVINSTCITAWLQNTGTTSVKITGAYVNGLIAILINNIQVKPDSTAAAFIQGTFIKGNTYMVKLQSMFNTVTTFEITY